MALVEQIEPSHWLIIVGVALVLFGVVGIVTSRTRTNSCGDGSGIFFGGPWIN